MQSSDTLSYHQPVTVPDGTGFAIAKTEGGVLVGVRQINTDGSRKGSAVNRIYPYVEVTIGIEETQPVRKARRRKGTAEGIESTAEERIETSDEEGLLD